MALTKIRLANKKAKREARRKMHHSQYTKETHMVKVRNKRMRKLAIQGRKEHLAKRRQELAYVKQLESEVVGEVEAQAQP